MTSTEYVSGAAFDSSRRNTIPRLTKRGAEAKSAKQNTKIISSQVHKTGRKSLTEPDIQKKPEGTETYHPAFPIYMAWSTAAPPFESKKTSGVCAAWQIEPDDITPTYRKLPGGVL